MKSKKMLVYAFTTLVFALHLNCAAQNNRGKQLKYLQLNKEKRTDNGSKAHIEILHEKDLNNEFSTDDRTVLRKMNLSREEKICALQEYLSFQGRSELSNKSYSNKYGRSENRIRLVKKSAEFPVEVEALYSLTSWLFDESVPISPVIINRTTGETCNFKRKDLDVVYKLYKNWFKQMKKEGFKNITWPLKNSAYMWLGEDVVTDIKTLVRKEL